MLLVQRGKELGYKMTDEDFNRVVTRIRTDNKLDTDEAFHAALKQEGMTMADLRASLEKQMLVTRVQQAEVMGKISITEEEARKYHAEHVQEFTRPGQVTIREIQVAVAKSDKGINVGLDDEAKAKAESARKRIVDGEAFEQVAGEVSTSPSRANGGLVGPLEPGRVDAGVPGAAQGAQARRRQRRHQDAGRLSDRQARVADGRRRARRPEEARDRIADAIFEQKRQVEFKKYLEKQRAQAIIEWKNEEIKKAWQSKVGVPAPEPAAAAPEKPSRTDELMSPYLRAERRTPSRPSRSRPTRSAGSPCGPEAGTSRSCGRSSTRSTSPRFCRRRPSGAAGRIAASRSKSRCFPGTSSRSSIPTRGWRC